MAVADDDLHDNGIIEASGERPPDRIRNAGGGRTGSRVGKAGPMGVLVSILDRGKRPECMSRDRRVRLVINVVLISSKVATIDKVEHKAPN